METEIKAKPELTVIREQEIPHILLPGEVGAILELTVKDKDGKVTEQRVLKSKSFVKQFLELLWVQAYPIGRVTYWSIRDTSDTLRNIPEEISNYAANAASGISSYGILVGTGTTAPTISDYKLETQIAHGVGVGQLQYGAVTFAAPAWDTTATQFTITRNFANASGGAITVNEIGLSVVGYVSYYFLTIRDVIGGGISVPNGQTLTVNYRLQAAI